MHVWGLDHTQTHQSISLSRWGLQWMRPIYDKGRVRSHFVCERLLFTRGALLMYVPPHNLTLWKKNEMQGPMIQYAMALGKLFFG